jgi:hypothetical protein
VFYNIQLLLRGLPQPSLMDTQLAAVTSPLLRLRVVQLKLWKVGPCCVCFVLQRLHCCCCLPRGYIGQHARPHPYAYVLSCSDCVCWELSSLRNSSRT